MKLHLLSINVHGNNDDNKVGIIWELIQILTPEFNVLRLQEHKCRGDTIDRTSKMLWRNDSFWNPKAIPSIGGEYVMEKEEWPCASTQNSRISLWVEELL